jgi:transmembrane sensor
MIAQLLKTTLSYLLTGLTILACALVLQLVYTWSTVGLRWTTASALMCAALLVAALFYSARYRRTRHEQARRWTVTHERTFSLKWAAFAASIVVGVALAFVAQIVVKSERVIATDAGQWRQTTLQDGSVVHVDARSKVEIEYTDAARIVYVHEGGAVFDVTKDPKRPFIVRTHLVDGTAIGTRFGVSIDAGVTATVSEGVVKITGRGRGEVKSVTLQAGEELHVSNNSLTSPRLAHVDAERKLEWTTGVLTLGGMTVSEGVNELNRRNQVQIVVDSPTLGSRIVKFASVKVDAPERYARIVAAEPGVRMTLDKENGVIRLSE